MPRPTIPHRLIPESWRSGIRWDVTFHVAHTGEITGLSVDAIVSRGEIIGSRKVQRGHYEARITRDVDVLDEAREGMIAAAVDACAEQLRFPF